MREFHGLRTMRRRTALGFLAAFVLISAGLCSPPHPDFSGTWKQSNDRCVPKRSGDVVRRVSQSGSSLVVETTIQRSSGPPRHAVQRYSLDGRPSVSTGADGVEFHTSVVWQGQNLAFSVEEHEDGRVLLSTETWSLMEDGSGLEIDRQTADASPGGTRKQVLVYLRQPLRQSPESTHP